MTDTELDAAVQKALDDGDNVTALALLVKSAGGTMTLYGQPVDADGLKAFAQSSLEQRFRWDAFVKGVTFEVPLRRLPRELKPFIAAARAMRGGDGGRDPRRRWFAIPSVNRTATSATVAGEIRDAF